MRKLYKENKDALRRFLANEADQQEWQGQESRALADELRDLAAFNVAEFERGVVEGTPGALESLREVIAPWWDEVTNSDISDKLVAWLRNKRVKSVRVSEPIEHHWPRKAYEVAYSGDEDSSAAAVFARLIVGLIDEGDGEKAEKLRRRATGVEENWQATWEIREQDGSLDLTVARRPAGYVSWTFGYIAEKFRLRANPEDVTAAKDANPEIYTGFAEQIERGSVWKTLFESLKR